MRDGYVQFGCGWSAPKEWRNFDASPTLRFERLPVIGRLYLKNATRFPSNVEYGDIVSGLPVRPESCHAVYSSHVLEHLSLNDFRIALRNTYSILKPGGRFRVVVPDLEFLARTYLSDPRAVAAHTFIRETGMGREQRPRGIYSLVVSVIGNSAHLWMWDYKALAAELEVAGFVKTRPAQFGDSGDPMFSLVERADRWENCVGVEAWKPKVAETTLAD